MLKRKRVWIIIVIIIIILVAVILKDREKNLKIDSETVNDKIKLDEAISTTLPETAEMLPMSENNLSHIEFFKIGNEEKALIAYKLKDTKNPLKIMVLNKKKGIWTKEDIISLVGDSIDKISIGEDSGDAINVTIGVKTDSSESKELSIYRLRDGMHEEIYSDSYIKYSVDEFKDDAKNLVVVRNSTESEKQIVLNYLELKEDYIKTIDSYSIDGVDNEPIIKFGNLNGKNKGLVIENTSDTNKGIIRLFKFDNNKIDPVMINSKNTIVNPYYVGIEDINEDGMLDIPILKKATETEENGGLWMTEWYTLKKDYSVERIDREYIDYENGFSFKIPANWEEDIGIESVVETTALGSIYDMVSFKVYSKNMTYRTKFRIYVFNIKDWGNEDKNNIDGESNEEYTVISKSKDNVYAYNNNKIGDYKDEFENQDRNLLLEDIKSRTKVLNFEQN